jgi:hypothetical protein
MLSSFTKQVAYPPVYALESDIRPVIESLEDKIVRIATEYNVSTTTLYNLAMSESSLGENRVGDQGKSCGVIHFNKDYFPEEFSRCDDDNYILSRASELISKGEEWRFTPCSCVQFAKARGVKLPKGNASDLFPNTEVPSVGGVIIMKYKSGEHHLIPITKDTIQPDGFHAVSANKEPCKITREIIPFDSKQIMGFYKYPE